MLIQDNAMPVPSREPFISTRALGTIGMLCSPMLYFASLFFSQNPDAPNPNQIYACLFAVLYLSGAMAAATAMRRLRVTGSGTGPAVLYTVQMIGLLLAMMSDFMEFTAPGLRQTAFFFTADMLAGAKLGLKSARIYDAYLAASAETDAKGYYEIKIPAGGARFDYAGFTFKYSRGLAALGLHPADGSLSESYPAATGGVENFVMLAYGIADAEGASKNARYRSNYYGGTLILRYIIAPPGQDPNDFARMLASGSEIVVTLTPVSSLSDGNNFSRAFEIRKKVENSSIGEFYVCNVPIGRYDISVKQADGKPLRLKQKNPTDSVFGIQPTETTESAQLIFNPLSADAKTAVASRGNWTDLEIIVERP